MARTTKPRASPARRPRRGARTRNPQESRRALVDAAARIFNTVGYHGTDTNRIARAAGYTPGSFYTHFRDKRSIFLEVYRRWVEEEFEVISAVLTSSPVGTRRRRLAKDILEHHRKWRVFRASLSALYAIDEEVRRVRLVERDRQIDGMIRNASEAGRIPPGRAAALASLLAAEALCDAVASGDAKALGIGEDAMLDIFQRALRLESAGRD